MYTKFQFDWTSTSSKNTSTKNFNLKPDERTYRPENIMPINGALKYFNMKTIIVFQISFIRIETLNFLSSLLTRTIHFIVVLTEDAGAVHLREISFEIIAFRVRDIRVTVYRYRPVYMM